MITALNKIVVSFLNYSADILSWIETELADLDQMVVTQPKEKGLLYWFCNKIRVYKSRKKSGFRFAKHA